MVTVCAHSVILYYCLQAGAVQQECGLPITSEEFVTSTLKFGLTEVRWGVKWNDCVFHRPQPFTRKSFGVDLPARLIQ